MAQFDLPLPEITAEDFERPWTCFCLVTDAKEQNEEKRLSIIPALLRGSWLDHFLEIAVDERETVSGLKAALAECAGLTTNTLTAALKIYGSQSAGEAACDGVCTRTEGAVPESS